jgi:hypothetical protein
MDVLRGNSDITEEEIEESNRQWFARERADAINKLKDSFTMTRG